MTPLRRFASSPLKEGRSWWPGKAGSTAALDNVVALVGRAQMQPLRAHV